MNDPGTWNGGRVRRGLQIQSNQSHKWFEVLVRAYLPQHVV
jgi:hypothetical protein